VTLAPGIRTHARRCPSGANRPSGAHAGQPASDRRGRGFLADRRDSCGTGDNDLTSGRASSVSIKRESVRQDRARQGRGSAWKPRAPY